uniref:Uncharacterized protein n=1 Tax=Grammatophora oceanica TaxID=210454 RepID=A0A7S1V5N7_9STRA|mmetsp:Transcript_37117/g.55293  ORF Transcript_37117/g.55293 Transcript_37117/m.55293 type:complete len:145 (+) Transcript_37117:114-548(+)|eukprot:CAMPEP_0194036438 /NCGR_PEP_ID=MMETSP0009_2-20130614/8779_1 /TAXON_ID=210454 /ORGANISM="Grammatophora oceanica, Strain CCMP 410" /LENGTH=144 /DNA_ID=CAMNT_0038678183 /DNA_START=83 /DNA_END=517 /DNA_ORIENTATION=-
MASKKAMNMAYIRELKRHIAPRGVTARKIREQEQRRAPQSQGGMALYGALGLVAVMGIVPYASVKLIGGMAEREDGLTQSQVRRGAFMNSGSRDVGRDPQWDFRKGEYIKDKGYLEMFKRDNPQEEDLGHEYFSKAGASPRKGR